ncbi:Hypothetical protein A7982_03024 [Minicystis rosea]|nr:Hypothetical protein A7982_03024 [Minicystis rosea]
MARERKAKRQAEDARVPAEEEPKTRAGSDADEADAEAGDTDAASEAEGRDDDGSERDVARTFQRWVAGDWIPRDFALLFGLVLPAMLLAVNMWRVHAFTVDDSYISFRYARNLARGWGLVYNEGERIEGYTNFLWTVILAGGIKLGFDPNNVAKVLGAASAFGSMSLTYAISNRLAPYRTLPCVATWLLASTVVFSGYAIFGLETGAFVFFVLAGTYLFLRETDATLRPDVEPASAPAREGFPWSGVVFALAGLTRPEAPMYIGILMLFLGRRFFSKQNILRGVVFAAPIAAHLLFRHAYYGSWVPNTLSAKTGNLQGQLQAGLGYVNNYLGHAGPVVYLALLGLGLGLAKKRRDLLAIATIGAAVMGYVVLVGGDWMKYFRFLAPFEPFCFLLVCVGVRRAVDRRDLATNVAVAIFAVVVTGHRSGMIRDAQADLLNKEKRFWDMAAGGTATWLKQNTTPGELAIGDIGYVGWETDYPILDLLGLVDPVISKLPGGYTQKLGPGFNQRFFDKKPKYLLLISAQNDCTHPSVPGSQVLYRDRRFHDQYQMAGKVPLDGGFNWCIYQRKN